MDGILVSSLDAVRRAWSRWALMRGLDPVYACQVSHGCRAIDSMAILRPDLDAAAEVHILESFELEDTYDITALPGVLHLLEALNRNPETCERWAVVTSASARLARRRMAAGGIPIPHCIVAAEQVARGKPHPDPFLAGAALLDLPPQECVVFEDSSSGVQAGRAAHCTVVATTFSHPIDNLEAAHYVISDLTGIQLTALPQAQGLTLSFLPFPAQA